MCPTPSFWRTGSEGGRGENCTISSCDDDRLLHARALRVCPHPVAMIRMRRTVGQPGHATEGAGQSDRESLSSVLSVFVNLSCAGAVEVVVFSFSTHVGTVTSFPHLLMLNVWLKKKHLRVAHWDCSETQDLLEYVGWREGNSVYLRNSNIRSSKLDV